MSLQTIKPVEESDSAAEGGHWVRTVLPAYISAPSPSCPSLLNLSGWPPPTRCVRVELPLAPLVVVMGLEGSGGQKAPVELWCKDQVTPVSNIQESHVSFFKGKRINSLQTLDVQVDLHQAAQDRDSASSHQPCRGNARSKLWLEGRGGGASRRTSPGEGGARVGERGRRPSSPCKRESTRSEPQARLGSQELRWGSMLPPRCEQKGCGAGAAGSLLPFP